MLHVKQMSYFRWISSCTGALVMAVELLIELHILVVVSTVSNLS